MKKLLLSLLLINTLFYTAYAQRQVKEKNFDNFNPSATFVVNNDGDTNDANTSDNICADVSGNCTLRAAIQQANASVEDDVITFALATPATINLTLGEVYINGGLVITGLGARNLVVQRNSATDFRIFNIVSQNRREISISGITIANGRITNSSGGGITNGNSFNFTTLLLNEVVIKNNMVLFSSGGGIFNNSGRIFITNSTISDNTVTGSSGGGIYNNGGEVTITNSTISNNTVNNSSQTAIGGGIANIEILNLTNVTITNNNGNINGGVFSSTSIVASANIRNTIIANNISNNNPDVQGKFNSLGNNLIGKGDGATGFTNGVNGDIVGTSTNPIDPLLGALQNNGGQTDTHALLLGSPAIDAGNNCVATATCPSNNPPEPLTTDQRGAGFFRLIDGNNDGVAIVDIGAFEFLRATAASVSIGGRVLNANGQAIFKAIVTLTNQNGEIKYAVTNPFGYYRFDNIGAGEIYILNVAHKRYAFTPQAYFVDSEHFNLNFTANP